MRRLLPPILLLSIVAWAAASPSADRPLEAPVVVELFTSQSCSSCPAADRALRELARRDHVLALSCHVNYWDHLGWKDTLSREDCTQRQRDYARDLGNGNRVYTPQMVVNGAVGFVGSNRDDARRALASARSLAAIAIERGDDEVFVADLPELSRAAYELHVFGYKAHHEEDVRSGENRGRQLRYANSVIYVGTPEPWDGSAGRRRIRVGDEQDRTIDGLTILAQSTDTGAIVGAGNVRIP